MCTRSVSHPAREPDDTLEPSSNLQIPAVPLDVLRLSSVLALVAGALPSRLAAITLASQIGAARLTTLVITGQLEWRNSNRGGGDFPNGLAKFNPTFGHHEVKGDRMACPSLMGQFANPQPEFINTEENGISRCITNDGVHLYSEWLDTHLKSCRPCCAAAKSITRRSAKPSHEPKLTSQRFRVALANVQPLTGRL